MKKYFGRIFAVAFITTLLVAGCTDEFAEINTDPDRAKDAPATNVLAFVIRYLSATQFDPWKDMNEVSTYAGYVAKIQYIDECRYQFRPGVVENNWYYDYILLNNINEIKKKAATDGATNLMAVAQTLEVVVFQIATDTWRDIPFTEAIKLNDGILLPKYDKQEDIYPALLAELKTAADAFASGGTDALGDGDIMFGGDVELWQKFANSLRLRLAMRISGVSSALAKSTVEEVLGNPSKYPVMESNDDNAFFWWPGASPYEEPWYTDSKTRDDHGISDVIVNVLKSLDDPRLPVYAFPAAADGEYRGFTIGAAAQPALTTISRIGERFRKDPAGFTPYMRYAEVMFHVAEAAKIGFSTGTTAQKAYEAGVTASLEENGIAKADIATYLAGKGKFDNTLDQIYLQEWIAMFKQGMEGWSLYRRTGIPKTHYVAPGSPYSGHNTPPFRYPYPANELTYNQANSKPFVDTVVDDFWGKQMWWDTRTGVH
ncbi:MAG: SusD/RagB family nutrient-binding outer membrane lipoprotein [Prolixibacteraceae bacterium]|jgi:hypothetical protein|nr:SusD/RagB family nutrient-binding outer membrane lipoprotein [Prolixibacteraceae bacterium]MDI9564429.1 SusD/RagB family nutrient-binding outer membrane lipoprotein [Bacteroidota bacterium]NLS98592.1 SusD/RagB family nutrient-binding outer membrane lipoprotein [Bacteroidales bacterium]OQB80229.1 MAG: Susd and RagB outer membrane lipoprotein [Bacteroidetes bacterium ADurb.Bin123]HNZ69609.1 SusD/RagB family nutrient-binding outer membrane lipoprotein [Prolixibacteraceae bacterium]